MRNDTLAGACREDEFVRLLSEHRHVLFNYIFCVVQTLPDAEDVFQQTTLSMWNNFHRFQPESDFRAWAIRFARFRALSFVRSKRRQKVFFSDKIIDQLAENALETAENQESRLRALAACREKLSAADQTLVALCYGRCDTIREAAVQLGRPLGAVYESLWRVRRALYACIQNTLAKEGRWLMDSNDRLPPEVWPLVDQMIDGLIAREGMEQLEQALEDNAALQKSVIEYCQLHVNLHCDARSKRVVDDFLSGFDSLPQANREDVSTRSAGPMLPIARPESDDQGSSIVTATRSTPVSLGHSKLLEYPGAWPLALAFSLGVAVALAGFSSWGSWQSKDAQVASSPQELRGSSHATPVAHLTSDTGCAWEDASVKFRYVGSTAQAGDEIALNEGIAEFRLSSGVYLSLEGPASMVLVSPTALVLQYGKLTAHVPWTVTDFKAITSACRVSACDAEFGIVQDGSKIGIHAFSGEVRADSPQAARGAGGGVSDGGLVVIEDSGVFTKATITEGNALSLIAEGEVLKVLSVGGKAMPQLFATKLPMAGALAASETYAHAVLASKPIGYWRFESFEGGVVPNEVAGGTALKVVGDPRITGRVDNSSIEFQPGSNCYLISEPIDELAGKDYSVEFWLKPSHVQRCGVLSLITDDPKENHAFYIELQGPRNQRTGGFSYLHPGAIRFLLRDPPSGDSKSGTSCFSKKPYTVRRWQHIVAEKMGPHMRLFVNGIRAGTTPDKGSLTSQLRLVLGQLETYSRLHKLVGQLDEVAIYDRMLPAEEIVEHYNAVEWNPSQKQMPHPDGA